MSGGETFRQKNDMHDIWSILNKEVHTRRERIGIVMASTFIFMLIANGYSWVEFYPIHDGVMHFLDVCR